MLITTYSKWKKQSQWHLQKVTIHSSLSYTHISRTWQRMTVTTATHHSHESGIDDVSDIDDDVLNSIWTFHSMSRWTVLCDLSVKICQIFYWLSIVSLMWWDGVRAPPWSVARPRVCVVTSSYAAQLLWQLWPSSLFALPVWTFYNSKVKSSKAATRGRRLLLLQKLLPIQKRIFSATSYVAIINYCSTSRTIRQK